MRNISIKAFTLVELAIVLVIVGLLVGGVLQGSELIKQAQMKKSISEITSYKTAIKTFELKYNKLPGDISNAKTYFPSCLETLPTATCNGNGNNKLEAYEPYMMWRHLALSKLLSGNYNINPTPLLAVDTPKFEIPNSASYNILGVSFDNTGDSYYYLPGNLFIISYTDQGNQDPTAEASECFYIGQLDSKIDDGKANKGIMRANSYPFNNWGGDVCYDTTYTIPSPNDPAAEYVNSSGNPKGSIEFGIKLD